MKGPPLQRKVVTFTDGSRQLNYRLKPLHLALDDCVEILLFHLREKQEVYGSCVASSGVFRNEFSQGLVDVLRKEGSI